ncbi:hypothetical protein [Burkholderia anthina]|uniref:hypothetical protein n=1 Tax=Burkholderia anthina TaxID=179879 RepID=UPI00158EBA76|nr:hypothetical protein [Burkholderia anthina]
MAQRCFPRWYACQKKDLSRLINYFVFTDLIDLDEIRLTWTLGSFDFTEKYCRSSAGISYSCVAAVALRSADCAARAVIRSAIRRRWLAGLRSDVHIDPLAVIMAFV